MQEQKSLDIIGEGKLKQNLDLIEAALYVAGRPLDLKTLGSILKIYSRKKIQKLVRSVIKKYEKRDTPLEILEVEDERFVLQLKGKYTPRVQRLAIRPLITEGPLKTLSYIAYRQPVLQKQVIEIRGQHAYNHLKQLEAMGIITRKKFERTKIIETTKFFADYFGFSRDVEKLKKQLKTAFQESR